MSKDFDIKKNNNMEVNMPMQNPIQNPIQNLIQNPIQNRYDIAYFFDVENGNPNGDPDNDNSPRIVPETGFGFTTDMCNKRKIRNYVYIIKDNESPYKIYIRDKAILNNIHKEAYSANGIKLNNNDDGKRKGKAEEVEKVRAWMCKHYYDVRTFGAVMATKVNCGQVTGPVQINFSRSIDPITPINVTITRMAVTTEEESDKQQGDNRTMGHKYIIPYALYRTECYISAFLAKQTGFNDDDLKIFLDSLLNMFDYDHSAARGKMNARKLIVFKHSTLLGDAPSYKLFDAVKVNRINNTDDLPPTKFEDYEIKLDRESIPSSIEVIEML